ncbi:hypothetical protein STRTUCAR8_01408 [Streptomyces turgidiscabies Car8]|uniref:Uncharacterized protein n=1 Tax=Streptomyces turgidiscabies (strain Car8) TaxID=698760 RepID=L7F3N0_STRT8|nr:hypothetical protein STRTUCAR8_01408 [Streptomyces turgidiscabies Car8]
MGPLTPPAHILRSPRLTQSLALPPLHRQAEVVSLAEDAPAPADGIPRCT